MVRGEELKKRIYQKLQLGHCCDPEVRSKSIQTCMNRYTLLSTHHHIIYIIVWCFICILSCENPNTKAIHCISSCGWLARQLQKSPIYRPIVCVCVYAHTHFIHECVSTVKGLSMNACHLHLVAQALIWCCILCVLYYARSVL